MGNSASSSDLTPSAACAPPVAVRRSNVRVEFVEFSSWKREGRVTLGTPFYVYTFRLRLDDHVWLVRRRMRDFHALRRTLLEQPGLFGDGVGHAAAAAAKTKPDRPVVSSSQAHAGLRLPRLVRRTDAWAQQTDRDAHSRQPILLEFMQAIASQEALWVLPCVREFCEVSALSFRRRCGGKSELSKEGWVRKTSGAGGRLATYTRRWLVLKDCFIAWFARSTDAEPKGVILLDGDFGVDGSPPGQPLAVRVSSGERCYTLQLASRREKSEWLRALRRMYDPDVCFRVTDRIDRRGEAGPLVVPSWLPPSHGQSRTTSGAAVVVRNTGAGATTATAAAAAAAAALGPPPGDGSYRDHGRGRGPNRDRDRDRFASEDRPQSGRERQPNAHGAFAPERHGCQAASYVGGREYFAAVAAAMMGANEEIFIAGWQLNPDLLLLRPPDGAVRLDQLLRHKARQGVRVFVLLYKEVSEAHQPNASRDAKEYLTALHDNINVMRHPWHFNILSTGSVFYSHHEKCVVVDQELAFVGGIDLAFGRYDDARHELNAVDETVWPGPEHYNSRWRLEPPRPPTPPSPLAADIAKRDHLQQQCAAHGLVRDRGPAHLAGGEVPRGGLAEVDAPPYSAGSGGEYKSIYDGTGGYTGFFDSDDDGTGTQLRTDEFERDADDDFTTVETALPGAAAATDADAAAAAVAATNPSLQSHGSDAGGILSPEPPISCPAGYDRGIFASLPPEIQRELSTVAAVVDGNTAATGGGSGTYSVSRAEASAEMFPGASLFETEAARLSGPGRATATPAAAVAAGAGVTAPPAGGKPVVNLMDEWSGPDLSASSARRSSAASTHTGLRMDGRHQSCPGLGRLPPQSASDGGGAVGASSSMPAGAADVPPLAAASAANDGGSAVEQNGPKFLFLDRATATRQPWQDVQVCVTGGAAKDVAFHFMQRWEHHRRQKGEKHCQKILLPDSDRQQSATNVRPALSLRLRDGGGAVCTLSPAEQGTMRLQVVRSAGHWSLAKGVETSIANVYEDLIEHSEHFIYIENQFFISASTADDTRGIHNRVGHALYERLCKAIERDSDSGGSAPNFRVFVLLPIHPEGSLRDPNVQALLGEVQRSIGRGEASLLGKLRKRFDKSNAELEKYIAFFSLRAHSSLPGGLASEMCYVHSKVMVVDDKVAVVGSANINDRSLLGSRDTELAVVVRDTADMEIQLDGRQAAARVFAHSLRHRLWREHVGLPPLYAERDYALHLPRPSAVLPPPDAGSVDLHLEVDLGDPVCDATWSTMLRIADENTRRLGRVFDGVESLDMIKTLGIGPGVGAASQLRLGRVGGGEQSLASIDAAAAADELRGVRGRLVRYPLQFLENEGLEAGVAVKTVHRDLFH